MNRKYGGVIAKEIGLVLYALTILIVVVYLELVPTANGLVQKGRHKWVYPVNTWVAAGVEETVRVWLGQDGVTSAPVAGRGALANPGDLSPIYPYPEIFLTA